MAFVNESLASITVENGNTTYDSRDNCNVIIETETNTLIFGCKNSVIPNGVVTIGEHAFSDCPLTSVTFPKSVTTICGYAFYNCPLKKVTIPSNVTSLDRYSFANCNSIESVKVNAKEPLTSISRFVSFFNSDGILYVPKGCTELYANANGWNSRWSAIKEFVNDEVASYTVEEDKGASVIDTSEPMVNEVDIPESITVDDKAYPVTAIADYAFGSNTVIKQITIPETIKEIGDAAFSGCCNLNTITSHVAEPIVLGSAMATARTRAYNEESTTCTVFDGVDKVICLLYVPVGSVGKYKAAEGWKDFKYIVEIGSDFIIGNVNGDDVLDEQDLQALIDHVMGKGHDGLFDENMADVNQDGNVNVNDVVFLVKLMGKNK